MGVWRKLTYLTTGGMLDVRSNNDIFGAYAKKQLRARRRAYLPVCAMRYDARLTQSARSDHAPQAGVRGYPRA